MWLTHKERLSAGEITVNDGIISERVATSRLPLLSTTVAAPTRSRLGGAIGWRSHTLADYRALLAVAFLRLSVVRDPERGHGVLCILLKPLLTG
jgi:hypothetical protein